MCTVLLPPGGYLTAVNNLKVCHPRCVRSITQNFSVYARKSIYTYLYIHIYIHIHIYIYLIYMLEL